MTRKISTIILLVCVLFGSCLNPLAGASAQNTEGVYTVGCLSNLLNQTSLQVYVVGKRAFMRCGDAASLSGYTLLHTDNEGAVFSRAGSKVSQNQILVHDSDVWVQIDDTMNKLRTKVTQEGSILAFHAQEHTRQDLFNLTDVYMEEGQYNLSENTNALLTVAGDLATLYNRLEGLQFYETMTGVYDVRKYNQVLKLIIDSSGSPDIVNLFTETNTIGKNLKTLQNYEFGSLSSDEMMELYRQGQIGDAGMVISIYNDLVDPVSYFIKNVINDEFSIGGLDLSAQLELYQNISAILSCNELYTNMVLYTFSKEDYQKAIKGVKLSLQELMGGSYGPFPDCYLPGTAGRAIEQVERFAKSIDYTKLLEEVAKQEIGTVGIETALNLLKTKNPYSILVSMQKLFNKYVFSDTVDTIDYMESYKYLVRLQKGLPELYRRYKNCDDTAINAKYCTLLYMRICQTAYEESINKGLVEAGVHNLGKQISEDMKKVIAISDSDLLGFEGNNRIDTQELLSIAVLPIPTDERLAEEPIVPIEQFIFPADGLAAWWAGSNEALREYIEERDRLYGRAENHISVINPPGVTAGYEMNDWINVFQGKSNYFNLFCDIISMGYGQYDFTDKHLDLIESELLGWGLTNGAPELRDEYYLFEISGNGTIDRICVRMTNENGVGIQARLYDSQDVQPSEDPSVTDLPSLSSVEEAFYEDSLYAMYNNISDSDYRARVSANDVAWGRTTGIYGNVEEFDIGYCGMLQGSANDAQAFLSNLLNSPSYAQGSSGIESVLYGDYYVSLWQTELYGWGSDGGRSAMCDEYYRFGILNRGDEQYEIYDVIFRTGYESEGGDWAEGRIINVSLEPIVKPDPVEEEVTPAPVPDEQITKPGELCYKWDEYARLDLWGNGVGQCGVEWRFSRYSPRENRAYVMDNGIDIGQIGGMFGKYEQNAHEWFKNVADEERGRGIEPVLSSHLAHLLKDGDTVEVTRSELYGWYMGVSNDGADMYCEEELYEITVNLYSVGTRYDIMFDMTSSYDDGEGLSSLLVEASQIDGWYVPEPTGENSDLNIPGNYDRGLVNAPLKAAGEEFFASYPWDQWTLLGDLREEGDTSNWTVATLFSSVGGVICVVDNGSEYVDLHAEADIGSQSLQRVYRGSGIPVLGFWGEWALCICEDYQENNPVCGWTRIKYLVSEEVYADDEYAAEAYTEEAYAEEAYAEEAYAEEEYAEEAYTEEAYAAEPDVYENQGKYAGTLTVVNCNEWVSLRSTPDSHSEKLAEVPLWANVEAYYCNSEWYQCQYNGVWGYILSEYLTDWPEKYDGYYEYFGIS